MTSPLALAAAVCALGVSTLATRAAAQPRFFSSSRGLVGLDTPAGARDRNVTMNLDETVVIFASTRPGGLGGLDLWQATRPIPGAPWGTPVPLTAVNSTADDDAPGLSPNGRELYFASDRVGSPGPMSLYVAQRNSIGGTFGAPTLMPTVVNQPGETVTDPQLSANGLQLVYSSTETGNGDLYAVARPLLGAAWANKQALTGANDPNARDSGPTPEAGGSIVWFSSDRTGGAGGADLYVTWRSASGGWATPIPVTELNTAADELGPYVPQSGTMYWDLGITNNPDETQCVCREDLEVNTLGGTNGEIDAQARAGWTVPVLFAAGADWELGRSATVGIYEWDDEDPINPAWGVFVSIRRATQPIRFPFIAKGALELDPVVLLPVLGGPITNGYGRLTINVPPNPGLANSQLWIQGFRLANDLTFRMAPPEHVTLR